MSAGFVPHVLELLSGLGRLEAKKMFGGYGVYCDGHFIAIVLDATLYLKTDAQSRPRFVRARLPQFEYSRKGKRAALNFYRAPADALESPELAREWAREALGAALRAPKRSR